MYIIHCQTKSWQRFSRGGRVDEEDWSTSWFKLRVAGLKQARVVQDLLRPSMVLTTDDEHNDPSPFSPFSQPLQ